MVIISDTGLIHLSRCLILKASLEHHEEYTENNYCGVQDEVAKVFFRADAFLRLKLEQLGIWTDK